MLSAKKSENGLVEIRGSIESQRHDMDVRLRYYCRGVHVIVEMLNLVKGIKELAKGCLYTNTFFVTDDFLLAWRQTNTLLIGYRWQAICLVKMPEMPSQFRVSLPSLSPFEGSFCSSEDFIPETPIAQYWHSKSLTCVSTNKG